MLAIITKMTLTQVGKDKWTLSQRSEMNGKSLKLVLESGTVLSCRVCRTQAGEVKQLFEPLVKTFVDSP